MKARSSKGLWVSLVATVMLSRLRLVRSFSSSNMAKAVPSVSEELTAWLEAQTSRAINHKSTTFKVCNPAQTDQILAQLPVHDADDAKAAISRAHSALPAWRDGQTAAARAALLTAWSRRLYEHIDDLATLMTLESGKPLKEARGEVAYAASFLDYYAAEAVRPHGFLVPTPFVHANDASTPRGHIMAVQQAVGTCAMIT